MGRVINLEQSGRERTRLIRSIAMALRELVNKEDIDAETRDLAAFISLALLAIWDGIEVTVTPWEKRGYWIKADHFRMAWMWSERLGLEMRRALLTEDWARIAQLAGQVANKLGDVKLPQRNRLSTPWSGAWSRLSSQSPRP